MIIHFFKNRAKDRIDFSQLIDGYFDLIDNSLIESTDSECILFADTILGAVEKKVCDVELLCVFIRPP